jgi:hypothetical protein
MPETIITGGRFLGIEIAHSIVTREKNPAAVELGRLGGRVGGKARAEKLTSEQRREIAQKAAKTRWSK